MAKKRVINGYAKNTGKFVLKNVTKALGMGLVGTGFMVSSLSKRHEVRSIGALAATIVCPMAVVCVAEAVIAKNLLEGIVTDKDPREGITKSLGNSMALIGTLGHAIGKGIGDIGHFISREAEERL